MNEQPTLIAVVGPHAAGETTITIELGSRLGLPVFTKDAIKESLHNSLGWADIESSR